MGREGSPAAPGAAKGQRIDAAQISLARPDALARDERAMQAVIARYAQGQMRIPNVVKVRGCRHSLASLVFSLTAGGPNDRPPMRTK
jgi:hypothetical protein